MITLRAERVRPAMGSFGVGERAERIGVESAGAAVKGFAELPAPSILCGFGGGDHLWLLSVAREEID